MADALNPAALSVEAAARVFTKLGMAATPEQIRLDIEAGAPTNADGTINLIHYAAWITREMGHAR